MVCTFQYEDATLAGRPLSVTETGTDGVSRITERLVYAGTSAEEKALNLAGQCVSHYDTAGLMQTDSLSLSGILLSVTRRLLKDVDKPDRIGREEGLKRTYIYAKRLVGKEKNVDFPACYNCSGILSGPENVMTGRV